MLVLSRRVGEVIVIETPTGKIEIVLIDTERRQARIGIKAPKEFTIYRAELGGYNRPTEEPR